MIFGKSAWANTPNENKIKNDNVKVVFFIILNFVKTIGSITSLKNINQISDLFRIESIAIHGKPKHVVLTG